MSKISLKEINIELKKSGIGENYDNMANTPFLGVYHYHEWDHGYETYHGYNGTRREFYADMRDSIDFLYDYINYYKISEFIVAPCYRYTQFTFNKKFDDDSCRDIYDEILIFLKKHEIRRSSRAGVKLPIDGNKAVIEMVIEGAFRGISTLCLLFTSNNTLLDPNHHFDLTFCTQNYSQQSIVIKELLKNHPNLRYFPGQYNVTSDGKILS